MGFFRYKSAVGGRQKGIAMIQSSTRAAVRQGVLV